MLFLIKAIDHIQLAAPKGSESRARDFFIGILGFTELEKPEALKKRGGVWFSNGEIQIHIGIEEPFFPSKKAHSAFEVKKIEELKRHLKTNYVMFEEDIHLPNAHRIFVFDPFGNRLEFLEWQSKEGPCR